MTHNLFHLITAIDYVIIGGALLLMFYWVWALPPDKRAKAFAPFLEPRGYRAMLRSWPLVFLFGAFIFACALDHAADYLVNIKSPHQATSEALEAFSIAEAVVSTLTAFVIIKLSASVWRWFSEGAWDRPDDAA